VPHGKSDVGATGVPVPTDRQTVQRADEALELLSQRGFGKNLAKQAVEIARQRGGLTVFSVVDALTRLSANLKNAGDRAEADERAGRLLALAA